MGEGGEEGEFGNSLASKKSTMSNTLFTNYYYDILHQLSVPQPVKDIVNLNSSSSRLICSQPNFPNFEQGSGNNKAKTSSKL